VPSRHAVTQYRDRVKPALSMRQARRELVAVLEHAEEFDEPPEWARKWSTHEGGYVVLADLCFPATVDGVLKTCLVRGSLSPQARLRRNRLRPRRAHRPVFYRRGRRLRDRRPREETLC
jgi:hypothetical protein